MKNLFIYSLGLLFFSGTQLCGCCSTAYAQCCKPSNTTSANVNKSVPKGAEEVKLKITGMTCAGCSNHIHTALSNTKGIIKNQVEYPGDVATITYDPKKITLPEIIAAIEKTGYKAEKIKS